MTTESPVIILINTRLPERLRQEAAALGRCVALVSDGDLAGDPALTERVEVVYGSLSDDQWARASSLRWLQSTGAGADSVLTPAALTHPATITNARIHGAPIAEHLFGMLLMLTRQLHLAYRQQLERRWDQAPFREGLGTLSGKTLGVLGLGAIGTQAAYVGAAFGMRVVGLRRTRPPGPAAPSPGPRPTSPIWGGHTPSQACPPGIERVFAPDALPEMLSQCDVALMALPLTQRTQGMIGEREFAAMKPGAVFINIGRGATVDTAALIAALRSGHLGGAGLDVTDPEPLPANSPLWTLPNVIITPHYGGLHPGYWERAGEVFIANLRRFLAGEPLLNVVDKEEGY